MRKNLKRILSLLLSVTIIFSASALISPAADLEDDNLSQFEYEINDGEVTITGHGFLNSSEIIIPDAIVDGYPVTKIGESAFEHLKNITSVEIPAGVTTIKDYAFFGCTSLTRVSIPDSVISIGDGVFSQCISLTSITIPDGVTSIGNFAFVDCCNLTSITIPESVTNMGYFIFDGCTNLTDVYYSGNEASWKKIYPMNENDNLAKVTIHYEQESLPVDYLTYSVNNNEVTITDCLESVSGDFVIPDTIENLPVTAIAGGAFAYCSKITSITIPDSVKSINGGCYGLDFSGYSGGAFENCTSLENITIPNSVILIGNDAFSDCTSLQNIILPDSVTTIGDNSFSGCESLTSIKIPNSVTSIGDYAFAWCENIESVTIPDSVTTIGDYTFYKCTSLESVTIPDSVTTIGDYTFYKCTSLESVTIPDSIIKIGDYAFSRCTSLQNITIPDSVTSIGNYAFGDCEALDNIVIPESVDFIGNNAFGINVYGEDSSGYEIVISPSTVNKITIIGTKGSVAEEYANTRDDINFIEIEEYEPTTAEPTTKVPVTHEYVSDEYISGENTTYPSYSEKVTIEIIPAPDSDITVGEWRVMVNAEMKATDIADEVENTDVRFFDANGKTLSENSYVGTGCIVRVYDGAEYSEYTVVVMCDIDGNGKITPADARLILRAAANLIILNDIQTIAGNIDGNDSLTTSDARKILRKAVGLE